MEEKDFCDQPVLSLNYTKNTGKFKFDERLRREMNNIYDELTPDSLKHYKKQFEDINNDQLPDEQFNKTAE